jgi:GNAT superfamily N-acetyltransferase
MDHDLPFRPYEPAMAPAVVLLWQRAVGDAYPLRERVLRQVTERNPGYRPSDAVTLWDGDELIGFGLLHRYREDQECCRSMGGRAWLTAILVAPERQRHGIGTAIFRHLRQGVSDLPDDAIQAGGGAHHLFPGPPEDLPAALPFCASLGFQAVGRVCDVRVDVSDYQLPTSATETIARHGLTTGPCRPEEWDQLLDFLLADFSPNWRYRAGGARDNGGDPADWLLLRRGEEIVGFAQTHAPGEVPVSPAQYWAALRGPAPGGFGPIGVASKLRGLGLGLALEPNVTNVIPGRVVFSVDLRHPDLAVLDALTERLTALVDRIAAERGVRGTVQRFWTSEPTAFDPAVVGTVAEACAALDLPRRRLWSGAGHDAKYLAEVCPTGMVFVRSRGGLSHCAAEYSAPTDVAAGANVLLHTALDLAG